jgi:hypothetical protein
MKDLSEAGKIFYFDDGLLKRYDKKPVRLSVVSGYLCVSLLRKKIAIHRLIFWLTNGDFSGEIDHRDRNKFNNSPSNLRLASRGDNCRNVGIPKTNTSGYKGVTWHKGAKKWVAQIRFNKKRFYLGLFDDALDAAKAHDKKCIELHGEFALTNKMLMLY